MYATLPERLAYRHNRRNIAGRAYLVCSSIGQSGYGNVERLRVRAPPYQQKAIVPNNQIKHLEK